MGYVGGDRGLAKVHILNYEPDRKGGGWTQARYLYDGLGGTPYDESEVVLITGATMASHEQVEQAKRDGKKIVLRVDNAVRDSRNRGTGMSRMKAFAEASDLIVYQSNWARNFLHPFLKKGGVVILNGVDTEVFKPPVIRAADDTYLYVRSSRDEGKQWVMAWYWFVNHPGHLDIVGRFSLENIDWNFDFYNDEDFTFWGEVKNMLFAYHRNANFLYSYSFDACSNTLLEARASGLNIIDVYGMLGTGGAPEIMALEDISVERMVREYKEAISVILP